MRSTWAISLSLVAVVVTLLWMDDLAWNVAGRDFYQVWAVARARHIEGIVDLYDAGQRRALGDQFVAAAESPKMSPHLKAAISYSESFYPQHLAANSTPLMYSVLAPFSDGDYTASLRIYNRLLNVLFVGAVLLLGRLAGLSFVASCMTLVAATWWFSPLRNEVVDSNVARLQLAGIAAWCWLVMRPRHAWLDVASGALMGLLVLFKPSIAMWPIFSAIVLAASGGYKRLALHGCGVMVAAGIGATFPAMVFGEKLGWSTWLSHIQAIRTAPYRISMGNLSGARLLEELLTIDLTVPMSLLLGAACVTALALAGRRERAMLPSANPGRLMMAAGALGCVLPTLTGPIAWPQYGVLALPLVMWCLSSHTRALPWVAATAMLLMAIKPLHAMGLAEDNFLAVAIWFNVAHLLLVAGACVAMVAGRGGLGPRVQPVDAPTTPSP